MMNCSNFNLIIYELVFILIKLSKFYYYEFMIIFILIKFI